MSARCATWTPTKAEQFEVRVIKLNKKRGNIVVSRKQLIEEEVVREAREDPGAPERGRGADRNGQEPDRVRRVRRPGRHRRPAAHHRHVLGTADSSPRPGAGGRPDSGQGTEVRPRQAARFARDSSSSRPIPGWMPPSAIPSEPTSRAASSALPITAPSSSWNRASRAWSTSAR